MILYLGMESSKDGNETFSVKEGENIYCPSCNRVMQYYDHCIRTYFDPKDHNQKKEIRIPRYKCTNKDCEHRYHRILPQEFLLPYERYTAEVIEDEIDNVIDGSPQEDRGTEAEGSTIRNWLKRFKYFAQYMNAAVVRCHLIQQDIQEEEKGTLYGYRELYIFRSQNPRGWLSKIVSQTIEILLYGFHRVCNACPP